MASGKRYRQLIAWIDIELKRNDKPNKSEHKIRMRLRRECKTLDKSKLSRLRETLVGKLRVWSSKVRDTNRETKFKKANSQYALTGRWQPEMSNGRITQPPSAECVSEFWTGIVGSAAEVDLADPALQGWKREIASKAVKTDGGPFVITDPIWELLMKKMRAFKAAGPDCIYAFFWKRLRKTNAILRRLVTEELNRPQFPGWMVNGRTVLIGKTEDQLELQNPSNYRPIAVLNVMYKVCTGVIARSLVSHCENNGLMPIEQRAARKGLWGTMDCLLADNLIMQWCKIKKVDLTVSWIDYQKAFDSVPHGLIDWLLDSIEFSSTLSAALRCAMKSWASRYTLRVSNKERLVTSLIQNKRGVFQGDQLSVVLFQLAMCPLSYALRTELPHLKMKGIRGTISNHLYAESGCF
jgi:hypothetical protein